MNSLSMYRQTPGSKQTYPFKSSNNICLSFFLTMIVKLKSSQLFSKFQEVADTPNLQPKQNAQSTLLTHPAPEILHASLFLLNHLTLLTSLMKPTWDDPLSHSVKHRVSTPLLLPTSLTICIRPCLNIRNRPKDFPKTRL